MYSSFSPGFLMIIHQMPTMVRMGARVSRCLNYAFYVCDEFSAPMIDSVSSYRPVDENLMGALL